jgi:hypothetical protein
MNDPRDSDSAFGVLDFLAWDHAKFRHHYRDEEIEKSLDLMKDAGVGFVRFDFLWEDLEPEQGRFAFAKYDRIVDAAHKRGIKILGILAYNPAWAGVPWNHAPDVVRYGHFARNVVNHFKDRVRHWQIWHEPDNPAFWHPEDQMQRYTLLLQHVYVLLKSVDPTCIIHLGGVSQALPMCLKNIYEKGGRLFFDVVDIHPFANPLVPDALDGLRFLHQTVSAVLKKYGDEEKPIWFTEIGCPGVKDPKAAANWWLGKNPTEEDQARWVQTVYGEPLTWKNVKKIFWCFFRDTDDHFKSGSDYDGLIRHDFSKKPSFEAYREMSAPRTLPAAL